MSKHIILPIATVAAVGFAGLAHAEGDLYIYNWSDYTSPELVEKFEAETGIEVTIDTYDSNETALAKLQSGATGYDIVVPSQHFVEIMISEGLLQKIGKDRWKPSVVEGTYGIKFTRYETFAGDLLFHLHQQLLDNLELKPVKH